MIEIAYIDDNKECLDVTKMAFNSHGVNIDTYDDPIQFYNSNKYYKVVISDFQMPNLDGQEFIKLLKEKNNNIKTIIYSGVVAQIENKLSNIDMYLSKPLEFERLIKGAKYLLHEYNQKNN